jgi:hypothetical protein
LHHARVFKILAIAGCVVLRCLSCRKVASPSRRLSSPALASSKKAAAFRARDQPNIARRRNRARIRSVFLRRYPSFQSFAFYAPREYKAKVISVSNVTFAEMGTGSFSYFSHWARGSTGNEFAAVGNVKINPQPLVEIPVNREVKYAVPKPAVSL